MVLRPYRLGRVADAEDLTQATFERALRSWGSFDERRGSARTWLLAISRNLLIDHYRAERPTGSSLPEVADQLAPDLVSIRAWSRRSRGYRSASAR